MFKLHGDQKARGERWGKPLRAQVSPKNQISYQSQRWTSHIPKHRQKYTNYYGVYSNVYRGKPHTLDLKKVEASETQKEYRKRWAILIRKVWEVDPLKCPRCGSKMYIDEYIQEAFTYLYKKMLVSMGAWYEEPERAPPAIGPPITEPQEIEVTYEPITDEWGSTDEFAGA